MNVSSGPLKNQPAERKWDGSWELRLCNNPSGSHPRAAGAAALAQSGPWARTRHLCSPACVLMRIWMDVIVTGAEGYTQFMN